MACGVWRVAGHGVWGVGRGVVRCGAVRWQQPSPTRVLSLPDRDQGLHLWHSRTATPYKRPLAANRCGDIDVDARPCANSHSLPNMPPVGQLLLNTIVEGHTVGRFRIFVVGGLVIKEPVRHTHLGSHINRHLAHARHTHTSTTSMSPSFSTMASRSASISGTMTLATLTLTSSLTISASLRVSNLESKCISRHDTLQLQASPYLLPPCLPRRFQTSCLPLTQYGHANHMHRCSIQFLVTHHVRLSPFELIFPPSAAH